MLDNGSEVDLKRSGWRLPTKRERILSHTKWDYYKNNNQGSIQDNLYYTDVLSGSFFIIRKNIFDEIGGFDENVFLYCEESILKLKINKLNKVYRSVVDISCKYDHRHKHKDPGDYALVSRVRKNTFNSMKYMFKVYYSTGKIDYIIFLLVQYTWVVLSCAKAYIKQLLSK